MIFDRDIAHAISCRHHIGHVQVRSRSGSGSYNRSYSTRAQKLLRRRTVAKQQIYIAAILPIRSPSFILRGITVEYDGSQWTFICFLPTWNYQGKSFPWKFHAVFHVKSHGVSIEIIFHAKGGQIPRGQKHMKTPWSPVVFSEV